MIRIAILAVCLITLFSSSGFSAEKEKSKPHPFSSSRNSTTVPNFYRPTLQFADVDKNGVIDQQESKVFNQGKLKVFDSDHNGTLEEKEAEAFNIIDKKLSKGGEKLEELNDELRKPYRKWRDFIYSLELESQEIARQQQKKENAKKQALKCYPDKICDDSSSPYYGK